MLTNVRKRDGTIVAFDASRIVRAISRAALACQDKEIDAKALSLQVADEVDKKFPEKTPTVEEIQDIVEQKLMESGHVIIAKSYILYRQERQRMREAKFNLLGKSFSSKLSLNALTVLRERYLIKDHKGLVIETPDEMFRRVANVIAKADKKYDKKADIKKTEDEFFEMMNELFFLPNSPTLMNAGTEPQQLSACFVLPVEDSISGIFETLKHAAIIHQSGGGTGFSFSRVRPRGDTVHTTHGTSSGPISFMRIYDIATEMIKQGGRRRGANMAILRVDHPDILSFITCKEKHGDLSNFNVSVAITEDFMDALKNNKPYPLINPRNKQVMRWLPAVDVWNLIITQAWKSGEPGVVFIDRMNEESSNPTPALGTIESTNPCGEVPLLPYESCNLGSINLSRMVKDGKIDFDKLAKTVHKAVHFLDNVVDLNDYPLKEIEKMTKNGNRKIGLGVMGFADMLYQLKIAYNSEEAVKIAEKVMKTIKEESKNASEALAGVRGTFGNWEKSVHYKKRRLRNATTTSIAPTGTLSMIADTSPGIEPNFAIVYVKRVLGGNELLVVNPIFERIAREAGFYRDDLFKEVANQGTLKGSPSVPKEWQEIFKVAYDVEAEWHAKIQAAFQKHVDNAVSKTVNLPSNATVKDAEKVYQLAYKLGCKGVTIYRDQSRSEQVMDIHAAKERMAICAPKENKCPECNTELLKKEGCATCPTCGYSFCLS